MISANKLSKTEVYFYFISWTLGIFYSVYQIYVLGNKFQYLFDYSLGPGWSFLHRKKDKCDDEWEIWVKFITNKLGVWILIHHFGARIIHKFSLKVLPAWYFLVTSAFLILHFDSYVFFIFLLQPIVFSVFISITKSRILLWIFCFVANSVSTHFITSLYGNSYNEEVQLVIAALMWIYLRCISFSMFSRTKKLNWILICSFFGYVFYLPCFFLGPVILYDKFYEKLNFKTKRYNYKSYVWLLLQNLRYFAWLYLTEFLLHFVYINCQQPYTQLLIDPKKENVWIMYGMGIAIGQFFFLKYTVVYGLALTWTMSEGYECPDPPKCVARIYLYSEMWRTFDQGLYIFIKKYIFDPCMGFIKSKTLFAKIFVGFVCFTFIYIWHGQHYFIFMWSLFNYCGIMIETIARQISKTRVYFRIKTWLGQRNEQRFIAFIAAPLTILSAVSNFYFIGIGGGEVAESYFDFFFRNGSFLSISCLWFFIYALCHVSMELNARDKMKKLNSG